MTTARPRTDETARVRAWWERNAATYERQIGFFEGLLFGGMRRWACSRAAGDVLEIGVGTGRNLPFYPDTVRLTGIDLSPTTLEMARRRAKDLGRDVELHEADAQELPFPDERFDAVLSTLVMCSIPDEGRAVAEVRRVLRPGGSFVLVEHVRSPNPVVRAGQRLLDPLSVRFAADHLLREPLEPLREHRFELRELERRKAGIVERIVARKPKEGGT